jgi:hypothetical protein
VQRSVQELSGRAAKGAEYRKNTKFHPVGLIGAEPYRRSISSSSTGSARPIGKGDTKAGKEIGSSEIDPNFIDRVVGRSDVIGAGAIGGIR